MVESMKPGSVIVDLAAEQGGNCALTEPGKVVDHKGVKIVGYTDLPSRMASMSSRLYGSCVAAFLEELGRSEDTPVRMSAKHEQEPRSEDSPSVTGSTPSLAGGTGDADKSVLVPLSSSDRRSDDHEDKSVLAPLPHIDLENEVVRGAVVLDHGKMLWPPPVREMPPPPEPGGSGKDVVQPVKTDAHGQADGKGLNPLVLVGLGVLLLLIGIYVPESKLSHFTVFMLAVFVGFQVVWNVKPALHTPLMSVTNAISGIILVGGMLQLSGSLTITTILGAVAVLIATINIAGGFLVTNRMLAMFRK
jgi:NAD(P) transhydrogenase subunit alpha